MCYLTPADKLVGVFIFNQSPQLGEEGRDVRVLLHPGFKRLGLWTNQKKLFFVARREGCCRLLYEGEKTHTATTSGNKKRTVIGREWFYVNPLTWNSMRTANHGCTSFVPQLTKRMAGWAELAFVFIESFSGASDRLPSMLKTHAHLFVAPPRGGDWDSIPFLMWTNLTLTIDFQIYTWPGSTNPCINLFICMLS